MAGKIVADTLEHSTAGSVTTDYVVNGVNKAWCNHGLTSNIRQSLNIASLTDNGTGDNNYNWTSVFDNADYVGAGFSESGNTNGNRGSSDSGIKSGGALSTSNVRLIHCYGATSSSNGSTEDQENTCAMFVGDLA
jgi:hypothetical protein